MSGKSGKEDAEQLGGMGGGTFFKAGGHK